MTNPHDYQGLLVLDKPAGITSRAAVDRVAAWFPRGTRIGHTGTLDPLATGVLVVCIGRATRLAEYVLGMDKAYQAEFLLGAHSDTDDAEGFVEPVPVDRPPDRATITEHLAHFIGEIDQVPPSFSAAKVAGRRAYALARRGQQIRPQARRVRIDDLVVRAYEYPRLEIEVRCGSGTYVRSLARDLGHRLGCGALVSRLRRTRVGPFTIEQSITLDVDASAARSRLLAPAIAVAALPRLVLEPGAIRQLQHGVPAPIPSSLTSHEAAQQAVAVFDTARNLVAVGRVDTAAQRVKPLKVFSR
jgi:tRNA pseudouridine55 synthase